MLGRKLRSGTFNTKERRTGTSSFVLEVTVCNLPSSIIYSVPCDRILEKLKYYFRQSQRTQYQSNPKQYRKVTQLGQENMRQLVAFGFGLTFDCMTK